MAFLHEARRRVDAGVGRDDGRILGHAVCYEHGIPTFPAGAVRLLPLPRALQEHEEAVRFRAPASSASLSDAGRLPRKYLSFVLSRRGRLS